MKMSDVRLYAHCLVWSIAIAILIVEIIRIYLLPNGGTVHIRKAVKNE